jgi:hypothetical protein
VSIASRKSIRADITQVGTGVFMLMFVMQDTGTSWDFNTMTGTHAPSGVTQFYILFLLAACVAGGVKLVDAWRTAAHLKEDVSSRKPEYFRILLTHITSLKRWIQLTILTWGFCLCVNLARDLTRLGFNFREIQNSFALFTALRDYLVFSTMAIFVVTFLYLVRWYLLNRLERAR